MAGPGVGEEMGWLDLGWRKKWAGWNWGGGRNALAGPRVEAHVRWQDLGWRKKCVECNAGVEARGWVGPWVRVNSEARGECGARNLYPSPRGGDEA